MSLWNVGFSGTSADASAGANAVAATARRAKNLAILIQLTSKDPTVKSNMSRGWLARKASIVYSTAIVSTLPSAVYAPRNPDPGPNFTRMLRFAPVGTNRRFRRDSRGPFSDSDPPASRIAMLKRAAPRDSLFGSRHTSFHFPGFGESRQRELISHQSYGCWSSHGNVSG